MRVKVAESERDPLELLFSQYLEDLRGGKAVDIEQFARQHPEQAEEIRELFPTLMALEQASKKSTEPKSRWKSPQSPAAEFGSGLHLGDYRLLREIGAGGMGIVYEAMQESMQRRVAVKVLPREFSNDPIRRERFLREARMAAQLSFPNIVPVIDFGDSDGRCFFAMRLVEGVGLDWVIQRLRDNSAPLASSEVAQHFRLQGVPLQASGEYDEEEDDDSLACEFNSIQKQSQADKSSDRWQLRRDSWRQFARIGIQAAKALQHAHKAGILHRDIKPGNLLLDEAGYIWVTDFGLAKSERELSLTASNDVVGTLRYLAPERFDGKLDARSDIYGLGLTLWELALQRPAFEESKRAGLVRAIMEGRITPPRQLNPQFPETLEHILMKATANRPAARYPTVSALIQDLRAYAKGEQVSAPVRKAVPRKPPSRIPWKGVAGVLAGVCLLQGALLWTQPTRHFPGLVLTDDAELARLDLRERRDALDDLYSIQFRRELQHDLDNLSQVTPLTPFSTQLEALDHLHLLYSRARQDAVRAELDEEIEAYQNRINLLRRLQPR